MHNKILKELLTSVDVNNLSRNEVIKQSLVVLKKKGYLNYTKSNLNDEFVFGIADCLDTDPYRFIETLHFKGYINDTVKNEVVGYLNNLSFGNDLNYQLNKLDEFELKIVNNNSLTEQDKNSFWVLLL